MKKNPNRLLWLTVILVFSQILGGCATTDAVSEVRQMGDSVISIHRKAQSF